MVARRSFYFGELKDCALTPEEVQAVRSTIEGSDRSIEVIGDGVRPLSADELRQAAEDMKHGRLVGGTDAQLAETMGIKPMPGASFPTPAPM